MMGRLSTALFLMTLAGALVLAACDDDEELTSQDGMSASEVLERTNEALLAVTSVRTETASVDGGFPAIEIPEFGTSEAQPPEASFTLSIEDSSGRRYSRDLDPPPESCVDLDKECLTAILDECRAADTDCTEDLLSESLWIGDALYHRKASDGAWTNESESEGCDESGCWLSHTLTVDQVCGPSPSLLPTATPVFSLASLFTLTSDYERLDDEVIDGATLIHLRGKVLDPREFTPPPGCETPVDTGPTPSLDFDFSEWAPNRLGGFFDTWIDPVTYLPARSLFDFGGYRDDREVWRSASLSVASDYNTAQIPGPLP
jgi:hypothetical protein